MTKRGVVISKLWDIRNLYFSSVNMDVKLNREILRTSLLYWDCIDIPDNTAISIELPPDVLELQKEGIISREIVECGFGAGSFINIGEGRNITLSNININGKRLDFRKLFNDIPIEAFKRLNNKKGVLWSHVIEEGATCFKGGISKDRECIFQIFNALPIPGENISFEEIIKFKTHRSPELESFRVAVNKLYVQYSHIEDVELLRDAVESEIEEAVRNLKRVAEEDLNSMKSKGLKFKFDLPNLVSAATFWGISPVLSAVQTGLSIFTFDRGKNLPLLRKDPYRYVADVQEILGGDRKIPHF